MEDSRHGKVEHAVEESDREYHKYTNKDPDQAWRFRVLKGQLLVLQGKPGDALELLQDDPPPSLAATDVLARRKMVQGLAHGFSQQFDQAEKELDEAEKLAGPHRPELQAQILQSYGSVDVNEAKYADADARFRKVLAIARDQHIPSLEAKALGSLGNVAMRREHYDEAVDWYKASLHLSQSSGAADVSATTFSNMGWSYSAMGDFENALIATKHAIELSSQAGTIGNRTYWLSNMGNYYFAERDFPAAESALLQSLALARTAKDVRTITQCLNDLALVDVETGRPDQAARYAEEALLLERGSSDRAGALYSLDVEGSVEADKGRFSQAERLFQEVIRDPLAGTSLRWEAEARLANVYAAAGERRKADGAFLQSIATIEAARSSVKTEEFRLSFLSSAISIYSDYIDFLVDHGRAADALQVAELSRARTLADGLGFNSAPLWFPVRGFQPMATANKLNATILSYWLGGAHSYAWVITPAKISLISLPPSDEIDSVVRAYRQALVGPRDVLDTANADGQKLYDLLVAPAAARKIPTGSRVIVIPDGSLFQLNFETLLVSKPTLHYWIDDVTIAKANSLLLLAASPHAQPAQNQRKLLLVGDPVAVSSEFPKLSQAQSEIAQIENFFPPSDRVVISGASATPAAYLEGHPGGFSFVHFVAHGISSRTSPLDSAVVLTKEGDSYKLYARDIVKQPLRADLVTISACHGAGERTYSGEGLVGLTWAFLRAGAHEVISGLWEVDDNSTTQLMAQLYGDLSKGVSADSALRESKLRLLHSGTVYKKPFYWAPFEIYRGP